MNDQIADILDPGCALETLRRWLALPDGEPMREALMPAVAHLACGHQRPTNRRLEPGDGEFCLGCGLAAGYVPVVRVEMLDEPQWFPHPDALSDLASAP